MKFPRASGILLHPTSLPGKFGIGDLGPNAFEFVDFLANAGQSYWQILPLCPTGYGNSPYSSYSAFAGNTLLISPEKLVDDGLLTSDDLNAVPKFSASRVDYEMAGDRKSKIIAKAFENFCAKPDPQINTEFEYFCRSNAWWLDDYAAFRAIKISHDDKPWYAWAAPLKLRNHAALDTVKAQLSREIQAGKFSQYLFFRQWLALKTYANDSGVQIIGDIPIFVALDSADVWCNQSIFKLNPDGSPKVVAGVPPDYFSKTGQLWGNPIYDWDAMRADRFGWWAARLSFSLMTVDIVRLDHFIGFTRNWEVPGADKTAENGRWADVPGIELFEALRSQMGGIPLIAEDLGSMTPEVEHLRDSLGMPGMRILQYAFGDDPQNRDLPHNYLPNCVAYTGTHDNDTIAGWYKSASKTERAFCHKYLDLKGRNIHWDMIRAIMASVADTVIVPLQDILGLGSDSRMNTPATAKGNWEWRLDGSSLTDNLAARLSEMTETYGRANELSKNAARLS